MTLFKLEPSQIEKKEHIKGGGHCNACLCQYLAYVLIFNLMCGLELVEKFVMVVGCGG
jgi:hypothetical protein